MRLAIGDRVLVDIPVVDPSTRKAVLTESGEQQIVTVPAIVSKFEQDDKGRIYTTFTFPSKKESIPYTQDLVRERITLQNLKLADITEHEF
jgi:hypothetical protein